MNMRLSGTLSAGGHRVFQLDCNADTEKEDVRTSSRIDARTLRSRRKS